MAKERVKYDHLNVLGQGSYVKVYEGLLDDNTKVAAKVFDFKNINIRDQSTLYVPVRMDTWTAGEITHMGV